LIIEASVVTYRPGLDAEVVCPVFTMRKRWSIFSLPGPDIQYDGTGGNPGRLGFDPTVSIVIVEIIYAPIPATYILERANH
jgi:hypothetical protein